MFRFDNFRRFAANTTKSRVVILPKKNTADKRIGNIQNFDELKSFYQKQKNNL